MDGLFTYSLLEGSDFLAGHGVALGDDGDQVDLVVESLHELDVERLEGVTGGCNKVQAGVDTGVSDLAAVDSVLLLKVCIETALNGSQDGLPAIEKRMDLSVSQSAEAQGEFVYAPKGLNNNNKKNDGSSPLLVVDKVTKTGGVDDIELEADAVLLNVGAQDLDIDSLEALLGERNVFLGGVQRGVEEGVDQGRLAQPGFT